MSKIVSRFAPSPTMADGCSPHLGFYRTLYHAWLAARASKKDNTEKGKFILRIDDTDLQRSTTENIDAIYKAIESIGLDWDETFKQSDRFDVYSQIAHGLVDSKHAIEDDGCIRLDKNSLNEINKSSPLCSWRDEISGDKSPNDDINSFAFNQVILKSDGSPTYNFCTVVDDMHSGVTDIIRGTDHISNTYKQLVIYNILEHSSIPRFHHVGLVCNTKGAKLSKRESNDMNLDSYNSSALLNFSLRMGWGPYVDNKEANIIGMEKAKTMFWDEGKLKASNAKINISKLDWLNKKHRNLSPSTNVK